MSSLETVHEVGGCRRNALRSNGRGMTLVEVLAATLIMGGAVTVALVAQASGLRQLKLADRTLVAQDIARELIAAWRIEEQDVSLPESGGVDGRDGWRWSRSVTEAKLDGGLAVTEVTLRIEYHERQGWEQPWYRDFHWLERDAKPASN